MTIRKLPVTNNAQIAAAKINHALMSLDSAELLLRHHYATRDQWKYLINVIEQLERISQTLKDNTEI